MSPDSRTDTQPTRPALRLRRKAIALVVPSLADAGGVPAVARFVKDTILRDGRFDLRLVSLATSASDPQSSCIASPRSWFSGAGTSAGVWEGLSFTHVGAIAGDFEFQRYRRRRVLTDALADCDLIQVICGSPACANAVVGLGKPVALQVATRARVERRQRDANPRDLSGWWRKAMTEITDQMDDSALRRVDAIQVENPWMFEYARTLNVGRDVDLRDAPPGVDARLFRPLEHRAPAQNPYILCVARLSDPRKKIGLLLEAYAQLPEALRNEVRLVFAGSSGPSDAFWQRVDALGLRERVSYVARPERDVLVRLYQHASVFALPSAEEGFGMVVIEAMACAVPVVSTRSGGPAGIITDGVDGYLVSLDDAAALSSRMARLLQDPALNIGMGRRARQTVDRRYDERIAGQVFIDMWDRLVHKGLVS
jgi:glycosyltransferase involved in cell wall biosynthesis